MSIVGRAGELTTGRDGDFTFDSVTSGTHTVLVTHDGFSPLSQSIEVPVVGRAMLEVVLPRQVSITEGLTVVGRISDYVDTAAAATRTSAPLMDIPQAIVVLPARLIADIGALDTKDLYKFMSGVADSPYSSTVVRGFTQREVLVNGAKGNPYGSFDGDVNNTGFSTSQFRLSNLERVEVLKGPASALYGSGEPGGIINYITKKPKDRFDARITTGTGTFAQRLFEGDVSGPLNASRTFLARAATYAEARDSFRNNATTRNIHAVGNLTWQPTSRSAVTLEYERIDQRNGAHRLRGVPVDAAGAFLADYDWTATEPTDFTDLVADVVQLRLDQRVGGRARFDSTFRWLSSDRRENYHEPRGITGGGTLMQREFRDQERNNTDWSWNAGLNLGVRTGRVAHDLTVGSEVVTQDFRFRFATARQQSAGGPVPPLALVNPVYGQTSAATLYGLTPDRYSVDTAQTTRVALFAQNLVKLTDALSILAGGRIDSYDDTGRSSGIDLAAEQSAATGRLGVVYKPVARLSIYTTASNGFTRAPILAQTPSANGPHDPERARQVEAGVKSDWLDGTLQMTGAFFTTSKTNVLRPDPAFGPTGSNTNAVLPVGKVRNRGFEFDLAGTPMPWFNVAFNYAYLDSEIVDDLTRALIGKPMPNAAPHTVGLFARVDLPARASLGASLQYVGDREEPYAAIKAPAFTTVDTQLMQDIGARFRLLLKVENLFDRHYAASSLFAARAGNMPGQPRTLSATLTWASRR